MERKKRVVPREVSPANETASTMHMKFVVTTNGEKSAEVIVPLWLQT